RPAALVVGAVRPGLQVAPVLLRRPALDGGSRLGAPAAHVHAPFALRPAFSRFFVEQPRLRRGAALVGERLHGYLPFVVADADGDRLAGLHVVGRLDALVAELDLPRLDRLLRQAARLEETRGPEPFVDTHPYAFAKTPIGQLTPVPPRPQ